MDNQALQLLCRFSLPPNSLGYCGQDSAPAKFKHCVVSGDCRGIKDELEHFIVLHPYLKTIAQAIKQPVFSYPVAESYWLGNNYLKQVGNENYRILLENFSVQGVPEFLIKELVKKQPKTFIPTHLFQVLHVGVGRASGSVPYNIETINQCMIRWGKVHKITSGTVEARLNSLKVDGPRYKLTQIKEKVAANLDLVAGLKEGDTIAVHWGQIIKNLSPEEEKKLDFWSREVVRNFNS